MSNEKHLVGLGIKGLYYIDLHSYFMGIVMSHYKDPY